MFRFESVINPDLAKESVKKLKLSSLIDAIEYNKKNRAYIVFISEQDFSETLPMRLFQNETEILFNILINELESRVNAGKASVSLLEEALSSVRYDPDFDSSKTPKIELET